MTLRDILTPRQFQFAELVAKGCTNEEIARRTGLATISISQRLMDIYRRARMHVRTGRGGYLPRVELAARVIREEIESKYAKP